MFKSILIAVAVVCAPMAAKALPVAFNYTAADTFSGATVTGTFGYDTAAVDINLDPAIGDYIGAAFITASITGGPQDGGVLSVSNFAVRVFGPPVQGLRISETPGQGATDIAIIGLVNGDGLPDSSNLLAAFTASGNNFLAIDDADLGLSTSQGLAYRLTSLSAVSSVPLPAGGILLISAIGGLGLLARRRKAA